MARLRYALSEVSFGLRRNVLITIATIVTVTVSLALLGAALLVQRQVSQTQRLFYAEVEVSIFLLDSMSPDQFGVLQRDLEAHPLVDEVIFESKQDAYRNYREIFADDPNLLASVTPEILPASFRVQMTEPERFDTIARQFGGYAGVEQVADQRDVLEDFFRVMRALRQSAFVIAAIQLSAAAALIFSTVRVTAFARREQTSIMKLVGASNWYIRLPFMLEGIVEGLSGAVLAGGLLLLAERSLLSRLRASVQFLPFVGTPDVVAVLPWLLAVGVIISALSSFFALRRFLSV